MLTIKESNKRFKRLQAKFKNHLSICLECKDEGKNLCESGKKLFGLMLSKGSYNHVNSYHAKIGLALILPEIKKEIPAL